MSDITVRPAHIDDSAAIAELITQLGYPSTEPEMHERLLAIAADADYVTYVAECDGRVAGMIGVRRGVHYERSGPYGQIIALVTAEAFRGRGIGALLVAEGERWLREIGANVVVVTSADHREGAHRFYERLGYDATGRRFFKRLS